MTNKIKAGQYEVIMTDSNYSSPPPYKASGKNCSNRIIRFTSPVPVDECVVQVQNNNFAEYAATNNNNTAKGNKSVTNRAAKMKVLMRADTHKHINVIKEEDEDQKEYKCNASQVGVFLISINIFHFFFLFHPGKNRF